MPGVDIESCIESIQEGESSESLESFVQANIDKIVDYLSLAGHKNTEKLKKQLAIQGIRSVITEYPLAYLVCTRKYLFSLRDIRANGSNKGISEGTVELCYETYLDVLRCLLHRDAQRVVALVREERGGSGCYLNLLLKSCTFAHVVDLFVSFLVTSDSSPGGWLAYLKEKRVVSLVIEHIKSKAALSKSYHNLAKILYSLISFVGCSRSADRDQESFLFFYESIGAAVPFLIDLLFREKDPLNRNALHHLLKQTIGVTERYPSLECQLPKHFADYILASSAREGSIMAAIREKSRERSSLVASLIFMDLLTRSIRFKSEALESSLHSTRAVSMLLEHVYSLSSLHSVSFPFCSLLSEIMHTDMEFYYRVLIDLSRTVKSLGLAEQQKLLSASYRKMSPHSSFTDHLTPILHLLNQLRKISLFESQTVHRPRAKSKGSVNRFTVIDKTSRMYQISEELAFLRTDEWYWYVTNILAEYDRRLSLTYVAESPEKLQGLNEQLARYLCECVAARLPNCPYS